MPLAPVLRSVLGSPLSPAIGEGVGVAAPVAVESQNWADNSYSPSADAFSASTIRTLTGADGKTLTEFAVDTLRRRDDWGCLLEPARTRLTGPPTDLNDNSFFTVVGSASRSDTGSYGSFNSVQITGTGATSYIQSGAFSITSGALHSQKMLIGRGTSPDMRSRIRSATANQNAELRGDFDAPVLTDVTLGAVANVRTTYLDSDNTAEISLTMTAGSSQADARIFIGPNAASTIFGYGHQIVAEPHAGEWITLAGGTTGADLMTRDITGLGLASAEITFALHGWAAGVTEAVILQLDDGDNNDRMALVVDTSTLALKAIFVVGGVEIEELTLGTIDLYTVYSAGLVWSSGSQIAQVHGNAVQTGAEAGTVPAFTTMRVAKAASGGDAYLRAVSRKTYDTALTASQLTGVLAAAAGPFDSEAFGAITVTDQLRRFQIGGESHDLDTYDGAVDWPLKRSFNAPNLWRFETRPGFRSPYDQANDRDNLRSEFNGVRQWTEAEHWIAFDTLIPDMSGAQLSSYQWMLCQIKTYPDPGLPIFRINAQSDGVRIAIAAGDGTGNPPSDDWVNVYYASPIASGVPDRWIARVKQDATGGTGGEVEVWRNGVQIVDQTGIALGYTTKSYVRPKFGDYLEYVDPSGPGVPGSISFRANMKFGTDLSHLLTRPYPRLF